MALDVRARQRAPGAGGGCGLPYGSGATHVHTYGAAVLTFTSTRPCWSEGSHALCVLSSLLMRLRAHSLQLEDVGVSHSRVRWVGIANGDGNEPRAPCVEGAHGGGGALEGDARSSRNLPARESGDLSPQRLVGVRCTRTGPSEATPLRVPTGRQTTS